MKKNKSKQNLIMVSLLVVFLIFIVGGILAYLIDTDEKINNFKIGNVDIILHEYNWMPDVYTTDDESGEPDAVQTNFGETVPKDPQVENVGHNPAYVYIKVEVPRASYDDGLTTIINESLFEYTIDSANWTELESARSVDETGKYNVYYYYYNDVLRSQETTPPLFEEITLKDTIPGVEENVLTVKVNAYAIQANGLPDGTTVDTTEWAEEFKAQGVDQGVSKSMLIAVGEGTLDEYTLNIDADDTVQIVLKKPQGVQGDFEEYTFSSSNETVATVTPNGLITGINGGTATVTITGSISGTTKTITVNVTGKLTVGECSVSVENDKMDVDGSEQIKITKPTGDKRKLEPVTYSSSNTAVATVNENGVITAVDGGIATITVLGSISGTSKTVDITVKAVGVADLSELETSNLGDYVELGTKLLDKTITLQDGSAPKTDWRVFKKENDGVWLILANYLAQDKMPQNIGRSITNALYELKYPNGSRQDILNGLDNETAWKKLLATTNLVDNENVIVRGAVDLPTWVESWNSNSEYTTLYITTSSNGYKIGSTENPTSNTYSVKTDDGYYNTLYFPVQKILNGCYGYWLASPSAASSAKVMRIKFPGSLDNGDYNGSFYGVRPAVYIPYNIQ